MSADTDPLFAARGGTVVSVDLGMNATFGDITLTGFLDAAKAMGVTWVRGAPEWGNSIHANKAAFTTDVTNAGAAGVWPALVAYQTACATAHSLGLKVLATALGAPTWARGAAGSGNASHQAPLPTERTSYAEYVRQLLVAGADAVEVVNEPNLQNEYRLGPDHPRFAFPDERNDDYVLLLQAVYARCKADSLVNAKPVGIGGTAVAGHEQIPDAPGGDIHPTTWYTKLFNAKADNRTTTISASGSFDFACHHPYADGGNNNGPVDWTHQRIAQPGDAVYQHGVAETWRIRQAIVAGGQGSKKIWATELGAGTAGGAGSVSEATQAQWMGDAIRAWFSKASSGYSAPLATEFYGSFTGPMFVYQWRDQSDGIIPPTSYHGFLGLQRFDGSAKPALAVYLAASTGRRGTVL